MLERVDGRLGNRTGSFVLQDAGRFVDGVAVSTFVIVEGSGTGELAGIRRGEPAARQDPIERLAVQHVEVDPLALAAAHGLQLRLVAPAPLVRDHLGQPAPGQLAADGRAPIHAGPEHVEEERPHPSHTDGPWRTSWRS